MKNLLACLLLVSALATLNLRAAESPVTISIDAKSPGAAIAPDFSGLSFETSLLLPNENGVRYFRPDNLPLIQLFHTLSIKSLRIGGNTSDRDAKQLPSDADFDSFFGRLAAKFAIHAALNDAEEGLRGASGRAPWSPSAKCAM